MSIAIAATNTTATTAAATTHVINLPDGIVTGNLLVIQAFTSDAGKYLSASGWSQYNSLMVQAGGNLCVLYRQVDGTEGFTGTGDTITLTIETSGSSTVTATANRITGHNTSTPTNTDNYAVSDFASATTFDLAAGTLTGVASNSIIIYGLAMKAVRNVTTWDSNGYLTDLIRENTTYSLLTAYDSAPGTQNRNYITTLNSARAIDVILIEIAAAAAGGSTDYQMLSAQVNNQGGF